MQGPERSRVRRLAPSVACAIIFFQALTSGQASPGNSYHRRLRSEQWSSHARQLPGYNSADLRYGAVQQKLRMRSEQQSQTIITPQISTSGWTPLGPAPFASDASAIGIQDYNWVSGRATAVIIDAADSTANTVYVGGAYGGVWKSTNALQSPSSVTWTPLIDSQATLAVGAIAIQPQLTNPNPAKSVILVGTGEANRPGNSYYGLGILRSGDAGNSWTMTSQDTTGLLSLEGLAFSKIAFSSANPNLVVAAAADSEEGTALGLANSSTSNLGLYYSNDGGVSWTHANVQDGTTQTVPGSATTVVYNAIARTFFAALRYHGFYSSTDGINWTRLANQPGLALSTAVCPAQTNNNGCPIYRGELAVVPGRNEMYAWYVDANDNDQGIWSSTNGGVTWSQIDEAGIIDCGDALGCGTEDGTYNLELSAVPDGGATDLYAGAVNIYKCQITSAVPDCSGTGANTFLNLTHVYGCSGIARVHPAQHGVSFQLLNSNVQDAMFFANDGGIYRALDGYSGLTAGACGGSNQFDSLNQTLGSMTQFVSFSQPSGDANTILGGAQGNGSPATQSALSDSPWLNVNGGDGGFTQINPNNADEWFVSNPSDFGTNIFRCESGINCHTQDFQSDQVVNAARLGGDIGAYYSPYLLDPQNSGELIVGTCRVWRGSSDGTDFTALTANFENGGSGICTGQETNLVISIAAGGPVDTNGFSNVIYAGTDGYGPLLPTTPPGGHVWVSPNVSSGAASWSDHTGSINPDSFPISSIAIDTSDSTGLTAFVGIQGFHVSHVWQTSNGGASWTDFTANLPDAPVNSLLVDAGSNPASGTLYAGTDVGVFATSTSLANWTEVGPTPGSGQSGYLPNVAVTALRMSNTGSDKLLRASTYGRGIWQFPLLTKPDFLITISNTPLTVFAGTNAVFNGSLFALDGYTNAVQLSCVSGVTPPPSTCSLTPGHAVPTSAGTPFTVTAVGADGSYTFQVKGSGNDTNHTVETASLTLNVVDFSLGAPSPDSVTVGPGKISQPIEFQVSASGPFNQIVNLSCAGLPSGASCNFAPSNSVAPTETSPVAISMTITTAPDASAGTFPITIQGSVTNGPTRSQTLSLTIIKDYSIAIANPNLSAYENAEASYNGTLTTLNDYSSPVNLSCGAGAPSTCTVSPAAVTPSSAGAAFTVTVSSPQCGLFNFNIVAIGTDPSAVSHFAPVSFTSNSLAKPNFTLEISNPALSSVVNASANFNGTLTSSACYDYPVKMSCGSGAPPNCSASPSALVPSAAGAPFIVSVSSNTSATYNFTIAASGTDPSTTQHTSLVTFTSTPAESNSFSLSNTSGSESIAPGQSATYSLSAAPSDGRFSADLVLAVSNCPPLSKCTLNPTQVAAGKGATAIRLSIQTTAATLGRQFQRRRVQIVFAFVLMLPGLTFVSAVGRVRSRFIASFFVSLLLLSMMIACGGGLEGGSTAPSEPGTPAGTYTMNVSASMPSAPGSPTKTASVTLVVQ